MCLFKFAPSPVNACSMARQSLLQALWIGNMLTYCILQLHENQRNESEREKEEILKQHEKELVTLKQKHREELDAVITNEKTSLTESYKLQIQHLENEVNRF